MSCNFDFLGFNPALEIKGYANLGLGELLEIAGTHVQHPDAFVCRCADGSYEARIKLDIDHEVLEVSARADSVKPVLSCVCQKMFGKICQVLPEAALAESLD